MLSETRDLLAQHIVWKVLTVVGVQKRKEWEKRPILFEHDALLRDDLQERLQRNLCPIVRRDGAYALDLFFFAFCAIVATTLFPGCIDRRLHKKLT